MSKYFFETNVDKIDKKEWETFVSKHPNGNIFQTYSYYKAFEGVKNKRPLIIAAYNSDKSLIAVQVSIIIRDFKGVLGKLSSRCITHGGPLISNDEDGILDSFLDEYIKLIDNRVVYSQIRNLFSLSKYMTNFRKSGFVYEDHLDIIFDLTKGEDQIFSEFHRMRKRGVKKAYKKGVKIHKIDLSDPKLLIEAYKIIESVYLRIKLPFPKIDFFRKAVSSFKQNIVALGLYADGKLIGVRIGLCYNYLIYDWYAGSLDEYLEYRPNDVLPWEMMKYGIENEFKIFDFGGAGKPNIPYGVRDYKLQFGGKLVNYGRFNFVHQPLLYFILSLGIKIKKKFE